MGSVPEFLLLKIERLIKRNFLRVCGNLIECTDIIYPFVFFHQQRAHYDSTCIDDWVVRFSIIIKARVIKRESTWFFPYILVHFFSNEFIGVGIVDDFADGGNAKLEERVSKLGELSISGAETSSKQLRVNLLQRRDDLQVRAFSTVVNVLFKFDLLVHPFEILFEFVKIVDNQVCLQNLFEELIMVGDVREGRLIELVVSLPGLHRMNQLLQP
mmetsp:Transcript_21665/g.20786  ORF Transcript_21665/g.20786 Transcript_21665/m.20786 type:complete len:214 (-) Transcript_21665:392-1033(-)